MTDETVHALHFDHPDHQHQYRVCVARTATLVENLRVLADLAERDKRVKALTEGTHGS